MWLIPFPCFAFLGPLITGFSEASPEGWASAPALRSGLVVGSALAFGWTIASLSRGSRLRWSVGMLGLSALLCVAPLFDLIAGPVRADGRILALETQRRHNSGNPGLFELRAMVIATSHSELTMRPSRVFRTEFAPLLLRCGVGGDVRVVWLRGLDRFEGAQCLIPSAQRR